MPNTQNRTSQRNNDRVRYDMIEHLGVLGTRKDSGWTREANIVSWNGGVAKVDIRDWDPDHERMSKGITLLEDEAEKLAKVLGKRYGLTGIGPVVPAEQAVPDFASDPMEPGEVAGGAA